MLYCPKFTFESAKFSGYKALEDNFIIESTGNIGGLVYENNSLIENSYVNAYVITIFKQNFYNTSIFDNFL